MEPRWGSAHLIFSAGSRVRTITLQELCIKGTILEFGLQYIVIEF